jgi:hypothetical protein
MIENDEIQSEPLETYHVYIWKEEEPETVIDSTPPVKQLRDNHGAIMMLVSSLIMALLVAVVPSTPISQQIVITHTFRLSDLQSYLLLPVTSSQSITVAASGKGHQDATHAEGTITFYNGQFQSVFVAAGTILTGASGIHIITSQDATIPAGNPPNYGVATVAAHAITSGAGGNIPSYSINVACCALSVKAVNTGSFVGGRDARNYLVVTRRDLEGGAAPLRQALFAQEQTALHAELTPNDTLIPHPCSSTATSNHRVGEEAARVTIHVSATCSASAYSRRALQEKALELVHTPTGFILTRLSVHVVRTTPTSVIAVVRYIMLYDFTERNETK